jgi:hypothetical protein
MKSVLYRVAAIAAELLAGFAAAIGCSKQNPEPTKPAEIRWRGVATGYEDTTKPADKSSLKP